MHVKHHLLSTAGIWSAISLAKREFNAPATLAFLAGGIFIDLDHFAYPLATLRPFTFKEVINWLSQEQQKSEPHFFFLHAFEAVLFLSLWLWSYSWGIYFLLGYYFHLLLDVFTYLKKRDDFYWLKKWWIGYNLYEWLRNKYA